MYFDLEALSKYKKALWHLKEESREKEIGMTYQRFKDILVVQCGLRMHLNVCISFL